MEKKLQKVMEACDSYTQERKNLLDVVHVDFPTYTKHDFMHPEETARQTEHYLGDLEQLRSGTEKS